MPYWIAAWGDHDYGLSGGGDLPWRDASQAVFLEAMDLTVERATWGIYQNNSARRWWFYSSGRARPALPQVAVF